MDGDVFAYRAAAAAQKAVNWGDDNSDDACRWVVTADMTDAINIIAADMDGLRDRLGGDNMIVAMSDRDNWRMDVLPSYKWNRATAVKPVILPQVRQWMRDNYDCWERPTLEGDDVLGILMTLTGPVWEERLGERICVTIDKDLKTIPGLHYALHKRENGVFEVTPEDADRFHLQQAIAGDVTDGYSGCPGMGMTTADDFLDDPYIVTPFEREIKSGKRAGETTTRWEKTPTEDVWAGIISLYAKAGMNEEFALQQARVARILRASDYNFKTKEPILWNP